MNMTELKEPAKRGSKAKVNISDHVLQDSATPHQRVLLVRQKLHGKFIRNSTEANC